MVNLFIDARINFPSQKIKKRILAIAGSGIKVTKTNN